MIKDPAESERCKNLNIREAPELRNVEDTRFYRVGRQRWGWKLRDRLKCERRN